MEPTVYLDVPAEVPVAEAGTLSRVLYRDDTIRVVAFSFDVGQELTEHTASVPIVLQVLAGRMRVAFADRTEEVDPGGWLRLDAHAPHSVLALEPSVLLLTLVKASTDA